jgi:hypothetical protein
MMGLAAAMLLALAVAPAHAKTLTCKTKKGDVFRNGTDGSMCEAISEDATGKAQAKATGAKSFSEAVVDKHGVAKATANGASTDGQADAFGHCHATGKAIGTGSKAFARCQIGGFAHATATNGGEADAYDDQAPTCIANNGATAVVHSTFGDCTKP